MRGKAVGGIRKGKVREEAVEGRGNIRKVREVRENKGRANKGERRNNRKKSRRK